MQPHILEAPLTGISMMSAPTQGFRYPFGEESCEHEVEVLQEKYHEYYYDQSRFNGEALNPEVYLIVGRRGSGKTSLTKFLEFQNVIDNASGLDINEPEIYEDIFKKITRQSSYSGSVLTARVTKIWEYILWTLIFNEYRHESNKIAAACLLVSPKGGPAYLVAEILKHLLSKFIEDDDGAIADEVETFLSSAAFNEARNEVLKIAHKKPLFIAIDTLERYDKHDEVMMKTTAALIQCANNFNISYAHRGLHVKAFIAAEIFPHIKEAWISNTTKFIRRPIYLHWRPKDLIRLICWRFYRFLELGCYDSYRPAKPVKWDTFSDVLKKMWFPFFGDDLSNGNGVAEKSFPYILRHTQMRPRQLVILCNEIARRSLEYSQFPHFKNLSIPDIIKQSELELSNEVLNSYAEIYPGVAEIVDALRGSPMMFEGNYLDKVAKSTAYAWPRGDYAPAKFRELVAELGIVGRVRSFDGKCGIAAADFEYTVTDRLALSSRDTCVIHPMFYTKLQTERDRNLIVFPFPDHPDFDELQDR